MRKSALAISIALSTFSLSTLSLNAHAAPCDSNFTTNGNFITGTTYKTFADLPNVSIADAFEGALADIAKEPSWKILAQDKTKGMIQAVQAESYNKGKVIPLNINIVPAGSGAKINMDYVTPTGSLSPASAVKSQFCQTIAAAEIGAGSSTLDVANNNSANPQTSTSQPQAANNSPQQLPGISTITPAQQNKIAKELAKKTAQKDMQVKISEASKTIQPFLERRACITEWKASSALDIYAAPGSSFANTGAPMVFGFQYHNKAQCLTIAKIQGWKSPALNALQFEVLYLAEDSGETKKENHELVKQPDGEWLFTH